MLGAAPILAAYSLAALVLLTLSPPQHGPNIGQREEGWEADLVRLVFPPERGGQEAASVAVVS